MRVSRGRGFALVATEVHALAGRSAAAKENKTLIGDSVTRVEQGSTPMDRAGRTMQEVVSAIRRVTNIMGEISAASREQNQGVSQVGDAVIQMDQVTQQNAALVEEMAAAASSLRSQVHDLVQTVAVFKLQLDHMGLVGMWRHQIPGSIPARNRCCSRCAEVRGAVAERKRAAPPGAVGGSSPTSDFVQQVM